jgi:hypothetical protein
VKLYRIHCQPLPEASRFIVVNLRGTRWAVPASRIIDLATIYYAQEGWDEDVPKRKQPKGAELRGLVEVNTDLCHHFKESHWDEVQDVAMLLKGDVEVNPDADECWWFEEQGGDIHELTTLSPHEQDLQFAECPAPAAREVGRG